MSTFPHSQGFAEARQAGFNFYGQPRKWMTRANGGISNMSELAQDAALVTTPNTTVPVEVLAYIDTEVTEILTAPRRARELFDEEKKGTWTTAYEKWRVAELTGSTQPYSDYANGTTSGVNNEWQTRAQYLFQTSITVGDLEQELSAEARINLLADKQRAAATIIDIDANKFALLGVADRDIYGVLNDPNLPAAITATAGASGSTNWASKTTLEIYNDILDLFQTLVSQSAGLIDASTPLKLAVSPEISVLLGKSTEFGITVKSLLDQYFGSITIVVVPELHTTTSETAMLIAPRVAGQKTGVIAFSEKLRTGRVVYDMSSLRQKWVSSTYGAIIKMPFAIAQMTAI